MTPHTHTHTRQPHPPHRPSPGRPGSATARWKPGPAGRPAGPTRRALEGLAAREPGPRRRQVPALPLAARLTRAGVLGTRNRGPGKLGFSRFQGAGKGGQGSDGVIAVGRARVRTASPQPARRSGITALNPPAAGYLAAADGRHCAIARACVWVRCGLCAEPSESPWPGPCPAAVLCLPVKAHHGSAHTYRTKRIARTASAPGYCPQGCWDAEL